MIRGDGDAALDLSCLEGLETHLSDLSVERLTGVLHWVPEDTPAEVNALIENFLSAPSGSSVGTTADPR